MKHFTYVIIVMYWPLIRLAFARHLPPRGKVCGRSMTAPTSATHQRFVIARVLCTRGNLPVQFYGHIGTDIAATSYQEIPTDGIAVLGMTKFLVVATIFHFLSVRFREGQVPPLHWPSFSFVAGDDTKIVNFPWGIFGANSFGLLSTAGHAII